jgi:hypothetical protein
MARRSRGFGAARKREEERGKKEWRREGRKRRSELGFLEEA